MTIHLVSCIYLGGEGEGDFRSPILPSEKGLILLLAIYGTFINPHSLRLDSDFNSIFY